MIQYSMMKRKFHAVGHGAFYTEHLVCGGQESNIVYDCGCFEIAKTGFSPSGFKLKINNAIDKEFAPGTEITALFISHFHTDHINGVEHLLERCKVKKIFIPKLSLSILVESIISYNELDKDSKPTLIDSLVQSQGENIGDIPVIQVETDEIKGGAEEQNYNTEDIETIISYSSGSRIALNNVWFYIPYFYKSNKDTQLIAALKNIIKLGKDIYGTAESVKNYVSINGVGNIKNIYEKVYGTKHNCYSMTVLSMPAFCAGKCSKNCLKANDINPRFCTSSCLYMGDYDAGVTDQMTGLKSYYENLKLWNYMGVIQVPHHGSENNYNDELYTPSRLCVISAGENDVYKHPDESVLEKLQNRGSIPLLVTDNDKTEQVFKINMCTDFR